MRITIPGIFLFFLAFSAFAQDIPRPEHPMPQEMRAGVA